MSISNTFFSGWLGYGAALSGVTLSEPTSSAYLRRAVVLAFDGSGRVEDVSTGSIGPADVLWQFAYAGLYDQVIGGNLLAAFPLAKTITVQIGQTLTVSRQYGFRLSIACGGYAPSLTLIAGSELGRTGSDQPVTACSNLQLADGSLSVISAVSSMTSLASLPTVAPAAGSGLLWNNGGVICIA